MDHNRLRELLEMNDAELDAYRFGYDHAMDFNWAALERVEKLERRYAWLVFMWFVVGATTGYLIGATFA